MNRLWSPNPKSITTSGLGSSSFARHYSRNRFFFLFLWVLRCFSSPRSPLIHYFTHVWISRLFFLLEFPHSDIPGLTLICSSPRLFAAYHVLHRLLVPRHSPYALCSLTSLLRISFILLCQTSSLLLNILYCIVLVVTLCLPCTTRFYCAVFFKILRQYGYSFLA